VFLSVERTLLIEGIFTTARSAAFKIYLNKLKSLKGNTPSEEIKFRRTGGILAIDKEFRGHNT
jgi:hypothetical protein